MGPDQWAEIVKDVIGSREAFQVLLQGAEYSAQRAAPDFMPHLWGSLRRCKEGVPYPFWESIGGITFNRLTKEMVCSMEHVPDELYQRAVKLAESTAVPGVLPSFDLKVLSPRWTYRMVAVTEWPSHVLAFYRKPKWWP